MLSQLDLNQKIFKFETFCKRGDPVWQEGRTRDHGWFIPNMVSEIFWIILEKFGQCVVIQHCAVRDPLNPSLWVAVENPFKWVFGSSLSQDS